MMFRSRTIGVGAVLGVALTLTACSPMSLQSLPKPGLSTNNTYPVRATFADALNLPIGAQVRAGALVVGKVTSLSTSDYHANVELRINNSHHLPVGTTAEVRFDNPLGDEYIELDEPAHPAGATIASGGQLTLAQTAAAPTIADTLGAFSTVLNGGGIGDVQTIAHELNLMFQGNQPQIRALLGNLNVAATDLAGGLGPIDDALDALSTLSTRLNASGDALPKALSALSQAAGILAGQHSQITELIAGLASFGTQGNEVIRTSGDQTVAALKELVPVVNQIVAADSQLTPALSNLRALEAQAPKVVTPGGYVKASVGMTVVINSAPSGVSADGAGAQPLATSLMTGLGPLPASGSANGGTR